MAKKDDIFKKQSEVSSLISMHKEMQKELTIMVCTSIMTQEEISDWSKKLFRFQEAYAKILYAELSAYILDERKDDTIKTIKDNIANISVFMDKSYKDLGIEKYNFWLKYKDHCELAILQRKHYHISIEEIEEKSKVAALDSVKSETDRIQKDLTSQLIGLVSIFTALSFVVFGGINILGSVLENVKLANITRLVCVGLMWTLSMSILFYVFVRFILKIMKPEKEQVLSEQFMCSFWILIGILIILFIVFVVFDNWIKLKELFPPPSIQPKEIIIHDLSK